jgi:hypothetical protein
MTLEQVTKILTDKGLSLETWLTFEDTDGNFQFTYLSSKSDKTIFIDPKSAQIWFSDLASGNYFLVRRTIGKPVASEDLPLDGYVSVSHKGSSYHLKLERGGKVHPTAGLFHEIISIDALVGFMYK